MCHLQRASTVLAVLVFLLTVLNNLDPAGSGRASAYPQAISLFDNDVLWNGDARGIVKREALRDADPSDESFKENPGEDVLPLANDFALLSKVDESEDGSTDSVTAETSADPEPDEGHEDSTMPTVVEQEPSNQIEDQSEPMNGIDLEVHNGLINSDSRLIKEPLVDHALEEISSDGAGLTETIITDQSEEAPVPNSQLNAIETEPTDAQPLSSEEHTVDAGLPEEVGIESGLNEENAIIVPVNLESVTLAESTDVPLISSPSPASEEPDPISDELTSASSHPIANHEDMQVQTETAESMVTLAPEMPVEPAISETDPAIPDEPNTSSNEDTVISEETQPFGDTDSIEGGGIVTFETDPEVHDMSVSDSIPIAPVDDSEDIVTEVTETLDNMAPVETVASSSAGTELLALPEESTSDSDLTVNVDESIEGNTESMETSATHGELLVEKTEPLTSENLVVTLPAEEEIGAVTEMSEAVESVSLEPDKPLTMEGGTGTSDDTEHVSDEVLENPAEIKSAEPNQTPVSEIAPLVSEDYSTEGSSATSFIEDTTEEISGVSIPEEGSAEPQESSDAKPQAEIPIDTTLNEGSASIAIDGTIQAPSEATETPIDTVTVESESETIVPAVSVGIEPPTENTAVPVEVSSVESDLPVSNNIEESTTEDVEVVPAGEQTEMLPDASEIPTDADSAEPEEPASTGTEPVASEKLSDESIEAVSLEQPAGDVTTKEIDLSQEIEPALPAVEPIADESTEVQTELPEESIAQGTISSVSSEDASISDSAAGLMETEPEDQITSEAGFVVSETLVAKDTGVVAPAEPAEVVNTETVPSPATEEISPDESAGTLAGTPSTQELIAEITLLPTSTDDTTVFDTETINVELESEGPTRAETGPSVSEELHDANTEAVSIEQPAGDVTAEEIDLSQETEPALPAVEPMTDESTGVETESLPPEVSIAQDATLSVPTEDASIRDSETGVPGTEPEDQISDGSVLAVSEALTDEDAGVVVPEKLAESVATAEIELTQETKPVQTIDELTPVDFTETHAESWTPGEPIVESTVSAVSTDDTIATLSDAIEAEQTDLTVGETGSATLDELSAGSVASELGEELTGIATMATDTTQETEFTSTDESAEIETEPSLSEDPIVETPLLSISTEVSAAVHMEPELKPSGVSEPEVDTSDKVDEVVTVDTEYAQVSTGAELEITPTEAAISEEPVTEGAVVSAVEEFSESMASKEMASVSEESIVFDTEPVVTSVEPSTDVSSEETSTESHPITVEELHVPIDTLGDTEMLVDISLDVSSESPASPSTEVQVPTIPPKEKPGAGILVKVETEEEDDDQYRVRPGRPKPPPYIKPEGREQSVQVDPEIEPISFGRGLTVGLVLLAMLVLLLSVGIILFLVWIRHHREPNADTDRLSRIESHAQTPETNGQGARAGRRGPRPGRGPSGTGVIKPGATSASGGLASKNALRRRQQQQRRARILAQDALLAETPRSPGCRFRCLNGDDYYVNPARADPVILVGARRNRVSTDSSSQRPTIANGQHANGTDVTTDGTDGYLTGEAPIALIDTDDLAQTTDSQEELPTRTSRPGASSAGPIVAAKPAESRRLPRHRGSAWKYIDEN